MENEWNERADHRPGGIGRKPGEAVRRPGDDRSSVDERRTFAPPRGPYRDERGYGYGGPEGWYESRDRRGVAPPPSGYGDATGPYGRDRGFWDRMSDEAASWFGDPYARERREEDHRGRGPKGYRRSDERINEDVHERLTEDRDLDASGMTVAVKDGEVILDGFVRNRGDKHRAEHIVEHISGVGHVQNNLRVGEPPAVAKNSILDRQASGDT